MSLGSTAVAPPQNLIDALRSKGKISRDDIERLLGNSTASSSSSGSKIRRQVEAVLVALDSRGSGEVQPEELLSWLYGGSAIPSAAGYTGGTSSASQDANGQPPKLREQAEKIAAADVEIANTREARDSSAGHTSNDIAHFKEWMEVSSESESALAQYRAMAQKLAEDFKSRGNNPQAEAFIEQLCVESILEGCLFVGHAKTDLDSIAGAIGGAYLFGGIATRAERELNGEITYALKFAGLEVPPYFDDVPGAVTPDSSGDLLRVCLVDHNEEKQMCDALRKDPERNKRICGLIDHHALSENFSSEKPLFLDIRPWGSMSTIVAHSFIRGNRELPQGIARILLAAILSDTLNLQSVTVTNADRMMVSLLSIMGGVDDPDELARAMFRAKTEWVVNLGAYEMTRGDQKDFAMIGWKFGISVLEVTDPKPVLDIADQLLLELRILKVEKGKHAGEAHDRRKELDFAYVFVVDITSQTSVLLIAGGRELALAREAFPGCSLRPAKPGIAAPGDTIAAHETLMEVGGLVSRKAQFVPAFFEALKSGFQCHKTPMSSISEEDAKQEPDDEIYVAMKTMAKESYHDSTCVVRNYKGLSQAYEKRASVRRQTIMKTADLAKLAVGTAAGAA